MLEMIRILFIIAIISSLIILFCYGTITYCTSKSKQEEQEEEKEYEEYEETKELMSSYLSESYI